MKTKQREIKWLLPVGQIFKSVPGFLITYDNEKPIESIEVISILEFLLGDSFLWLSG